MSKCLTQGRKSSIIQRGGWGGREVQDGETCATMGDSCQCMPETTTIVYRDSVLQLDIWRHQPPSEMWKTKECILLKEKNALVEDMPAGFLPNPGWQYFFRLGFSASTQTGSCCWEFRLRGKNKGLELAYVGWKSRLHHFLKVSSYRNLSETLSLCFLIRQMEKSKPHPLLMKFKYE